MPPPAPNLPPQKTNLRKAYTLLEHPNLAIQLTNLIGVPIQKGIESGETEKKFVRRAALQ